MDILVSNTGFAERATKTNIEDDAVVRVLAINLKNFVVRNKACTANVERWKRYCSCFIIIDRACASRYVRIYHSLRWGT